MLEIKNLTKVFGEGEDSFVAVNKINLKPHCKMKLN